MVNEIQFLRACRYLNNDTKQKIIDDFKRLERKMRHRSINIYIDVLSSHDKITQEDWDYLKKQVDNLETGEDSLLDNPPSDVDDWNFIDNPNTNRFC